MNGIEWEIKCPIGNGKRTIEKSYHKAALQSKNIIFDLRRISLPEKLAITQLEREFNDKHTIRLLVITKAGDLLEYPEKP